MTQKKRYKILYKLKTCLSCEWKDLVRLSDEQLSYINHNILRSSFLEACPGSGKTEVIGIKTAFEIYKWQSLTSGIALVTFTTSAAKELNTRIRKFAGSASDVFPHFIGTFDSWVHNYILQPFSHYLTGYAGKDGDKSIRLVDVDSSAGFLSIYTTMIARAGRLVPLKVVDYYYDHNNIIHGGNTIAEAILAGGITAAETKQLKDNKVAFIKAGFATYSDADHLCNRLMVKFPILAKRLAKRFPVIVVDECQDLSTGQINIIESLRSEGSRLHFVGDLHQSIYEFRKVNPAEILHYIQAKGLEVLKLTNNYRSCQSIVTVCENIIGGNPAIIGHEPEKCLHSCILWQCAPAEYEKLPAKFEKLVLQNGLGLNRSVVLARGKSTLSPFRSQSDKYGKDKVELFALALHCWFKPNRTTDEMESAMLYAGRVLCLLGNEGKGNPRLQYCPDIKSGVEWRLFLSKFLIQAKALYPFVDNGADIDWTTWIPKLKAHLSPLWDNSGFVTPWDQVKTKLRSPDKRKNETVKTICSHTGMKNNFRTTTIHSVKGETTDAVLLISSLTKQSPGGHFSHWLQGPGADPEHLRFAYVASSRPRYLLVIATPILTAPQLLQMTNLGLVPQAMP
jgi:DNA helicase-2/ATP-dependent DNA helicase PcrA